MKAGNDNQSVDIIMLALGLIIGIAIFGLFSLTNFGGAPSNEALDAAERQGGGQLVALDQVTAFRFGRGASGFFVSDDGCIVTNAHVVEYLFLNNQKYAIVYLPIDSDTHYYYKYAEILKVGNSTFGAGWDGGVDKDDLAVLKLDMNDPIYFIDENLNEVEADIEFQITPIIININEPEFQSGVFTVGHPNALGGWVPTVGVFATELKFDEFGVDFNEYLFDLVTFPGNSGGPILNLNGQLVGVVWGGMLDMSYSEWLADISFEEDNLFWYFPIDNTDPNLSLDAIRDDIAINHYEAVYEHSEPVITVHNIGYYLDYVGFWSTAAEKSTTVADFVKGTPCKITTTNDEPINFYDPELDGIDEIKEIEHITELFYDKVKYQVVAIDGWTILDEEPAEMRSSFGTLNTNLAVFFVALISSVILIYKRRR